MWLPLLTTRSAIEEKVREAEVLLALIGKRVELTRREVIVHTKEKTASQEVSPERCKAVDARKEHKRNKWRTLLSQ
jgi:hypothetical protein